MSSSNPSQAPQTQNRSGIVAGACITQFVIIGLLFAYSVLFEVFETEFGWSRTVLSGATSVAFVMMGTLGILAGRLNDRLGPRLVLGTSGIIFGVGYALLSQISQPWQLLAIFALFISVGMATHDIVTLSTIARWFPNRRGIMSGYVKVGTAMGQVCMPIIIAFLITQFDWRTAVTILGGLAIILLFGSAMAMKSPPKPVDTGNVQAADGLTFPEAKQSRSFWTFCAIQFLFFFAIMTVPVHMVIHGTDLGMTKPVAASLLSVMGAASIAGRLVIGHLVDRIGGKGALSICFIPLIFSLASLILIEAHWMLFAIIAIYGFSHGGLFTVVSPTIAEYFGLRAHGAIFGAILFFGTLGGATGPLLAGYLFDTTGSYTSTFITLTLAVVLGLVMVLSLPSSSKPVTAS